MAVSAVDDYNTSTRSLSAAALRNILGTRNLGEILSERSPALPHTLTINIFMYSYRDSIAMEMKLTLDAATCPWGVLVERVEVKDVRVPEQLQRAMAAEAEAAREARAKVIAAEGEHKASRALRQAAEVIVDSPAALQLRYLQTLNSISAENNSTIVFPVPIDIMSTFMTATANSEMTPESGHSYQQQQQQQQQQSYQQQSHSAATATPRDRKVSIQVRRREVEGGKEGGKQTRK